MTESSPVMHDLAGTLLWDGLSQTKFRAPRQRRDQVPRPALVARAEALVTEHPLTLIAAPAGFGKSTLLLQLAQQLATTWQVVWLSLDSDDNDPNRFFVSLAAALRELPLRWDIDPRLLASQVNSPGQAHRTIASVLANALASLPDCRLLLILDDLHCVSDAAALQLLADLVDRLPPSVSLLLSSRLEPALPLARWRVRGELGQLDFQDLQFDETEAESLARIRWNNANALSANFVSQALQRTQGWAAGLSLVFGVASGPLVEHLQSAVDKTASRHLFDFFAQEVLAELPPDLADFILRCSVLPELTPVLCQAVTGRQDVHGVLEDLYRRNLFLTALDETLPVLRFHDLFREFLQNRLERLHPGLASELHAKAASADKVQVRAVNHWLKAAQWKSAVAAIDACLEPLLAEGSLAMVERWIAQLPAPWMTRPEVIRLQAMCAWAGWDFERVFQLLELACAGFREQGNDAQWLLHAALLPRAYNASGRLLEADRTLNELETLPLSLRSRVNCLGARAWQELAMGRPAKIAGCLSAIADEAAQDLSLLSPAIDDMFNSFLFGLPAVHLPIRRLQALCRARLERNDNAWQITAFAHTTWLEFWHGDRAATRAAVQAQSQLQARLSIVPALRLNARQAEAWEAAAAGDASRAVALGSQTLAALDELAIPGLMATWRRATTFNLAAYNWIAQDLDALRALWPYLGKQPSAVEWPFINTARAQLRGQIALLEGDLVAAETALLEAEKLQQAWPMPTFIGDVRVSLAWLYLQQHKPEQAWQAFAPVVAICQQEDSLGLLLTAPGFVVDALMALMPSPTPIAWQPLLARLQGWRTPEASVRSAPAPSPVLQELSEREREVLALLAAGDSNKLIARTLDLSPHTVKRHVANILAKLDCTSRGQAAALWRRHLPN